jgi:hypothetical protein
MAVNSRDLIRLAGWPRGVNNVAREDQLRDGIVGRDGSNAGELRVGENIDLDEEGKPSVRPGRQLAKALPGLHSVWAEDPWPLMLGGYDGSLIAFDSTLDHQAVATLTAPRAPIAFALGAGYAYWSNGFDCGRVRDDGTASPWAPEQPIGQPAVAANAAGGMHAGNYAVAITYLDETGRESGATLAVEVDVTEGQGIALTLIPQPVRADSAWIRVYCSAADGEGLRFVRDLPVGMTSFLIGVHEPGKLLETQFLEPLPAGEVLATHHGRLLVRRGRDLFWSEALHYGLGNLASNYLRFSAPGGLIAPIGEGEASGVFVDVAGRDGQPGSTYFLAGADPKVWRRVRAYPHGAVPGSLAHVEATALGVEATGRVPCWITDHGQFVVGLPGGRVQELHRDRFTANERMERASTALRTYRGMRSLIAAGRGGATSPFAIGDRASAEIWRDGVRIG